MGKPIAIASDHAGFDYKEQVKSFLEGKGYSVLDLGTATRDSVDYPDFGHALGKAIEAGQAERGVLICGTGIGISIAANRNPFVRAALCHDVTGARLSRQHNDANVICLGQRVTGLTVALDCVEAFLNTDFEGGRHQGRVNKLGGKK